MVVRRKSPPRRAGVVVRLSAHRVNRPPGRPAVRTVPLIAPARSDDPLGEPGGPAMPLRDAVNGLGTGELTCSTVVSLRDLPLMTTSVNVPSVLTVQRRKPRSSTLRVGGVPRKTLGEAGP